MVDLKNWIIIRFYYFWGKIQVDSGGSGFRSQSAYICKSNPGET